MNHNNINKKEMFLYLGKHQKFRTFFLCINNNFYMSIRQEQLFLIQARPDLSCDQLRSTLQNINSRLSNLQQCIPNPQHWRDKITKETAVPRLDLHKIQAQKENLMPQKKVTATFGEKHQESIEKCEEKKPQIRMVQQTPQRIRSCSMNGSQQVLRSQNNHQIQFKVTNASRLQNSIENQYYQSLHQSNEKTLNQSFTGSQQIYSTDQNMLVQPTLQQKPIIFDQNQQLGNTRNNSLLSTPVKQVAHVSQGQTPLRRGNSTTQQKERSES
ncbi:hypothetical protein FGO68_gene11671 [Halteria grandinella]|uniref:Uncharacterized protein n=1 Tax=Halteria grandinella TaxID=5974 RepID=A0A8J8NFA5_HALGN|nr:hypothetical protein FGO68_gene11671 [Halteria grandinella]